MSAIFSPSTIEKAPLGENELEWNSTFSTTYGKILGSRLSTSGQLFHLSNPACGDLRNSTQALYFLDFQINDIPLVISGIEVNVKSQRNGRAADEQVQLIYQGSAIGKNNFMYFTDEDGNLPISNDTTYGGPTDLWGAELTSTILQDTSFGVILKFQAHPYFPHRSGMMLDSVLLTVY